MATLLVHNACLAGAMGGMLAGRGINSFTLTDYAAIATVANTVAAECLTRNAALSVPFADADAPSPLSLIQSVAEGVMHGRSPTSVTAADYLNIANEIMAAAKQASASLT